MSEFWQNILVLAVVAICLAIVVRQAFRTFTFRGRSKLGACCSKGCDTESSREKPPSTQFLPVEMLGRKR